MNTYVGSIAGPARPEQGGRAPTGPDTAKTPPGMPGWTSFALPMASAASYVPAQNPGSGSTIPVAALQDAVRVGLAQDPDYQIARGNVDRAGTDVAIARSGYLPTLEFTAGIDADEEQDHTLSVSQPLWSWGKITSGVRKARQTLHSEEANAVAVQNRRAGEIVLAYFEVLRFQQQERKARENVHIHERIRDRAQMRVDNGAIDKSEGELAGVRLQDARTRLSEVSGSLYGAKVRFRALVGRTPGALRFPPPLAGEGSLPSGELSLEDTPALRAAKHRIEAAEQFVEEERRSLLPRITLDAEIDFDDGAQDERVMLRLKSPTFNGFTNFLRVDAAKKALEIERTRSRQAEIELQRALRELATWRETLQRNSALLKSQSVQVANVVSLYEKQFTVGSRSLYDLVNAQSDRFRVVIETVNNRIDLATIPYQEAALLGQLVRRMGLANE